MRRLQDGREHDARAVHGAVRAQALDRARRDGDRAGQGSMAGTRRHAHGVEPPGNDCVPAVEATTGTRVGRRAGRRPPGID